MSAPVKVVHLVEDMKVGGAERVIASIARGLDPGRYAPEVWCLARGGAVADELAAEGRRVRVLDIATYRNPANFLRLARLLSREGVALLHAHGYYGGVLGRVAGRLAGLKAVLYHVHSTHWCLDRRHKLIERALSRWTDRIVCCSEAVRRFVVEEERVAAAKALVVHNGVDVAAFDASGRRAAARMELGISPDAFVAGVLGRLAEVKGHRFLVEAAGSLAADLPGLRLLFVGDGPLRGDLAGQAEALGIRDRVIFAGERPDVPRFLAAMDALLLPSMSEGLSVALIEGMASGLPAIGTDVGGNPELIADGESGILCKPADPASLAAALRRLVLDEGLRRAMGEAGRRIARERFSLAGMMGKIEALYAEILESKGAQR